MHPAQLLSRVIAAKLEEQGVQNATQYLDKIEPEIQAILDKSTMDGFRSFQIQTGNAEIDARNIELTLGQSDITLAIDQTSKAIEESIPRMTDDVAKLLLRRIKSDAREGLKVRNLEKSVFESGLWIRWGRALDLLALEIALALEAGEQANRWLRRHRKGSDSFMFDVLIRLHARACQVAGEVETLLSSGYADGAIARWRTLHELSVVSWFIKDKGNNVAERYILHTTIDSLRAARQYNQLAPIIGYKTLSQKELSTLEREASKLVRRFGCLYREEYGWAADALGNKNPRFVDIEKSVDLRALRPFYKLASHNVHAGPKGAMFRLGLLQTEKPILLAGPSNAGLDEAGRLTAISLSQITVGLLLYCATFDSLAWSKILLSLSRETEDIFIKIGKQLEREERGRIKKKRVRAGAADTPIRKRSRKPI